MIKEILEKWSCKHQWELIAKNIVYEDDDKEENGDYPIRVIRLLDCKLCGKLKKIRL